MSKYIYFKATVCYYLQLTVTADIDSQDQTSLSIYLSSSHIKQSELYLIMWLSSVFPENLTFPSFSFNSWLDLLHVYLPWCTCVMCNDMCVCAVIRPWGRRCVWRTACTPGRGFPVCGPALWSDPSYQSAAPQTLTHTNTHMAEQITNINPNTKPALHFMHELIFPLRMWHTNMFTLPSELGYEHSHTV